MRVEEGIYKRGKRYQVRWREGGRNRARSFTHIADAREWRDRARRNRERGILEPLASKSLTLTAWTEQYVKARAGDWSPHTWRGYERILNTHILPYLGGYQLTQIRPALVAQWQQERLDSGAGRRSIAQARALLSSLFRHAIAQEFVFSNPVEAIPAPRVQRKIVSPLTPDEVERIRYHLIERGNLADATLVSVMAYAGLRPQEALALTYADIQDGSLLISKKNIEGEIVPSTKNGQPRRVTLLAPVARDLQEWAEAEGQPGPNALVFHRPRDLQPFGASSYNKFRANRFTPAAKAAGCPDATPYHLRHSFASLLVAGGSPLPEVAAQCGHDLATSVRHYMHLMGSLGEQSPAEAILAARKRVFAEGSQAN